jgi:hypothetical protein
VVGAAEEVIDAWNEEVVLSFHVVVLSFHVVELTFATAFSNFRRSIHMFCALLYLLDAIVL